MANASSNRGCCPYDSLPKRILQAHRKIKHRLAVNAWIRPQIAVAVLPTIAGSRAADNSSPLGLGDLLVDQVLRRYGVAKRQLR